MIDKKFLRKLKGKEVLDGSVILKRIYGSELPKPVRLFRFHFNNCTRPLKKQEREKLQEFTPFLREHLFNTEDWLSIFVPIAGQLILLLGIIKSYNTRLIKLYAFCTEEVEIGYKDNKGFRRENKKVLYDGLSAPTIEEIKLINNNQLYRVIYLIFISIVHFLTFGFLNILQLITSLN